VGTLYTRTTSIIINHHSSIAVMSHKFMTFMFVLCTFVVIFSNDESRSCFKCRYLPRLRHRLIPVIAGWPATSKQ